MTQLLLKSVIHFNKKTSYDKKTQNQMGYKIWTLGVQNFLWYEMGKRDIVPQNGVQLAALVRSYQ
jgi:hypothetical protein